MRTRHWLWMLGSAAVAACGGQEQTSSDASDGGATDGLVSQDAPLGDSGIPDSSAGDDGGICGQTLGPGVCGASLCGNGVRDTCPDCFGPGGGGAGGGGGPPPQGDACTTVTEACDGADLAGQTCTGLKYAGGSLACSAACTFDASVCSTCSPTTQGPGCTPAPQARGVSVGASATEIGLAWVAHGGGCEGVRFDRYAQDLTRISESACLSSCDAVAVAVASTPGGWLLAVKVQAGVEVFALDATGAARGPSRLIATASSPILASGGASGTLLTWAVPPHQDVYAAVLADDGTEAHPSALAFSTSIEAHRGDAVFVGDGFLAGERASLGRDTIVVRRVNLDGSLGTPQAPTPGYSEYPQLAWTGTEARLVYAQFSSGADGMYWTRLDAQGAPVGTTVEIGPYPDVYARSPIVAVGSDTLALIGNMGRLDLVHISSAGVVSAPSSVTAQGIAEQKMVLSGTTAFAAWLEDAGSQSFVQDTPGGLMGRAALVKVGP